MKNDLNTCREGKKVCLGLLHCSYWVIEWIGRVEYGKGSWKALGGIYTSELELSTLRKTQNFCDCGTILFRLDSKSIIETAGEVTEADRIHKESAADYDNDVNRLICDGSRKSSRYSPCNTNDH